MINRWLIYLTRHIDRYLLSLVAILLLIGLITLYSASGGSLERVGAQMLNILVALTAMWIAASVPLHYLSRIALPLYVIGVLLLLGVTLGGSREWRPALVKSGYYANPALRDDENRRAADACMVFRSL